MFFREKCSCLLFRQLRLYHKVFHTTGLENQSVKRLNGSPRARSRGFYVRAARVIELGKTYQEMAIVTFKQ